MIHLIFALTLNTAHAQEVQILPTDEQIGQDQVADGYSYYARKVKCDGKEFALVIRSGGFKVTTEATGMCHWNLRKQKGSCDNDRKADTVTCYFLTQANLPPINGNPGATQTSDPTSTN
jgi:hypothetical protein